MSVRQMAGKSMSGKVFGKTPGKASEKAPENMPENMPKKTLEKTLEKASGRTLGSAPRRALGSALKGTPGKTPAKTLGETLGVCAAAALGKAAALLATSAALAAVALAAALLLVAAAPTSLAVALDVLPAPLAADVAWADESPNANEVNPQQLPDSSFIYDTSISDLDKADSYMDGQTVQITGEVVGDRIRAELDESHCWITLQAVDGSYAEMNVFSTLVAADCIDTYGAYGKRGSTIQVRGTFNLSCSEHEGETDLHAEHISLVSKGSTQKDEFDPATFIPGAVLIVVGFVLVVVFYRLRESQR